MNISKKEAYTLLTSEETEFLSFFETFKESYTTLSNEHLVVLLSENLNIESKNLFLFLDYANQSKANGTSFVIVKSGIDIDDFEESFNIVPTLLEAEDVLEMEAIERDLGF